MLKKDLDNKMFFGVCSGLSKEMGIDVSYVRILFVLFTLLGFGTPALLYLILALVMQ